MYDFYLMHENTKVLKFNITTDINIFTNLCEFEILNKKYLPYPVKLAKEEDREATFWLWFTTRYMDRHQEGFLDFTNFLHNNFTNRGYKVPYFCSLFTYGMSMNDHYWLNPVREIELGRVLDAGCPYKFKLLPTVYDIARSNFLDWDDDIEKIVSIINENKQGDNDSEIFDIINQVSQFIRTSNNESLKDYINHPRNFFTKNMVTLSMDNSL